MSRHSDRLRRCEGSLSTRQSILKKTNSELLRQCENIEELKKSLEICDEALKTGQRQVRTIEQVQTSTLRLVYNPEYAYTLLPIYDGETLKGLKPTITKGNIEAKPDDAFGDGVQALLSFSGLLLRSTMLGQKLLLVNEPLAYLPAYQWEGVIETVERLAKVSGLQIFMTTHGKPIGRTFWVQQDEEGQSTVRTVRAEEADYVRGE